MRMVAATIDNMADFCEAMRTRRRPVERPRSSPKESVHGKSVRTGDVACIDIGNQRWNSVGAVHDYMA
jgi:hypothetical protein